MDAQEQGPEDVAQAVMLFAKDTIMAALRVMQEHGVRRLPVVDEERGEWLGEVTEEQLRRLWKVAPLSSMAEILTGTPSGMAENLHASRPPVAPAEVREFASLVDFYRVAPDSWWH
ncbi:CBS domain-containing protein [[Archangium] primigenium]|uniref:CBS domain-containing protein n=1 Tax=Melittangium TaxID=44 RepID=UPI00195CD440|nr:CBS domain-containing protein [Archangium primigenium]MBM7114511.1 CBS domain-containing protein [Archangium primigenium]